MYLKHECLNFRYPYGSRTRKAVWRGASTGRPIQSSRDIKLNQRISLSFLGKKLPDIFDVGITDYVQVNPLLSLSFHIVLRWTSVWTK